MKEHHHGRAKHQARQHGNCINSQPDPGSFFAMGWAGAPTKDFIQFGKSPKKKNYLVMGSILIYFFIVSELDHLQYDHIP